LGPTKMQEGLAPAEAIVPTAHGRQGPVMTDEWRATIYKYVIRPILSAFQSTLPKYECHKRQLAFVSTKHDEWTKFNFIHLRLLTVLFLPENS